MSIERHAGNLREPTVHNAESMYGTIQEWGLLPFFENLIPGYSVEELTPPRYWFDGEEDGLGPWDWKIECVRSGDIAYGKFLLGGKAAFATLPWYRELRNYRQSLPKYQPDAAQQQILDYVDSHGGAITIREVRQLLGIKKSAADALIARLQMQCLLVTGDLLRVYRGEDLHYNGWQVASFCRPEDLFDAPDFQGFPGFPKADVHPLQPDCTPEESLDRLCARVTALTGERDRSRLLKLLG